MKNPEVLSWNSLNAHVCAFQGWHQSINSTMHSSELAHVVDILLPQATDDRRPSRNLILDATTAQVLLAIYSAGQHWTSIQTLECWSIPRYVPRCILPFKPEGLWKHQGWKLAHVKTLEALNLWKCLRVGSKHWIEESPRVCLHSKARGWTIERNILNVPKFEDLNTPRGRDTTKELATQWATTISTNFVKGKIPLNIYHSWAMWHS